MQYLEINVCWLLLRSFYDKRAEEKIKLTIISYPDPNVFGRMYSVTKERFVEYIFIFFILEFYKQLKKFTDFAYRITQKVFSETD